MENKFLYPALAENIHRYAASIFTPIKRGECVSAVWVPMAGRRIVNRFIIENYPLFKKELPDQDKYIFVYIEPLDLTEESTAGYLQLMGKSFFQACKAHGKCHEIFTDDSEQLFDSQSASYPKLLETLKSCLKKATNAKLEIVFFLGEFDELDKFANKIFYNNLKSLWDFLKPNLHYIFLVVEDLSTPELTDRFGELNAATLENVIYVPIDNGPDRDYLIDRFSSKYNRQISPAEKDLIKDLCGGHAYLIKAATRIIASVDGKNIPINQLEKTLSNHYELLSVAQRIYNLRTPEEREVIRRVVHKLPISNLPHSQRLVNLGLLIPDGQNYKPFGSLLTTVVLKSEEQTQQKTPVVENIAGSLHLSDAGEILGPNGLPIEEKFTRQEYELVRFFLKQPGKLQSRDSISEVLWGSDSYEKYSDWAIDQIMSKVRKKLKDLGLQTNLVTIRGRGYKLLN